MPAVPWFLHRRTRGMAGAPASRIRTLSFRAVTAARSALGKVPALLGGDEEFVLGVDERLAAIVGELVLLLEIDGIFGARLFTHAAENAAEHVDLVAARIPLAVGARVLRLVLRCLDIDGVGRAGHRAQLAS